MSKVMLKNVRLSFPSVFHKANFNGQETKYEATMLIPKSDKKLIKKIQEEMKLVQGKLKVSSDKFCLKDGDDVEYEGFADHFSLKASNSKRPTVINRDREPITEDDDVIYGGCYVNAIVDFWAQNNNYGKRINANLLGVQFVKHGEPFGEGGTSAGANDFDDISDDFDDDDDDF